MYFALPDIFSVQLFLVVPSLTELLTDEFSTASIAEKSLVINPSQRPGEN